MLAGVYFGPFSGERNEPSTAFGVYGIAIALSFRTCALWYEVASDLDERFGDGSSIIGDDRKCLIGRTLPIMLNICAQVTPHRINPPTTRPSILEDATSLSRGGRPAHPGH